MISVITVDYYYTFQRKSFLDKIQENEIRHLVLLLLFCSFCSCFDSTFTTPFTDATH